uniref:Ubiquitin fusion degradation protein UFD1 N-terminal subdomain 1 domain-containing protein n=1 Tax=Aegilops tauschii subsp. strangulata TaxID=200361 RepID=A0A453DXU2_AEGTS
NAATLDLEASHCGVLEFVAEEGFVYVPALTMARLGLEEDDLVLRTSTSLPKATSVKLLPEAGSSGKGKGASEHVLRFFGGRRSVPPGGAKWAKKVDGEEDKEAKRFN